VALDRHTACSRSWLTPFFSFSFSLGCKVSRALARAEATLALQATNASSHQICKRCVFLFVRCDERFFREKKSRQLLFRTRWRHTASKRSGAGLASRVAAFSGRPSLARPLRDALIASLLFF
jgi:hypothetical protein